VADIQTTRFGRYLQALFNLKQALTLGEAMPDVVASVDLENPRPEGELFLGNDLCQGFDAVTAAAAEFSQVSLGFGATPSSQRLGSLIVIEKIIIRLGATGQVGLSFGSVAAHTASTQKVKTDTRRFAQAPFAKLGTFSNAVLPTSFQTFAVTTNVPLIFDTNIVLCPVPGSFEQAGLIVSHETAATALRVGFQWRERQVRADELVV